MSAHPLQDVFTLFDSGKLKDQNEGQLRCLFNICVNCQGNDLFARTKASHIANAILGELVRLQNDRLVDQVGKLAQVADAQKKLAEEAAKQAANLSKQTDRLIGLTWGLVAVSVALLAFALIQTAIMVKQNANAHAQQIQAGQHQEGASTNQ